jgi:hypothetical protein
MVGSSLCMFHSALLSHHLFYDGYIFVKPVKTEKKTFFYITSVSRGEKHQYMITTDHDNIFEVAFEIEKMFKNFFGLNMKVIPGIKFKRTKDHNLTTIEDFTYCFNGGEVFTHSPSIDLTKVDKIHGCKLGSIIQKVLTNCYKKKGTI